MFTLKKSPDRDFLILNLTDTQLGNEEWDKNHKNFKILTTTIRTLIERERPDLITVSGDLAWAGCTHAYTMLADFLDSFKIPWAPVWGNHDNQNGPESVDAVADMFLAHEYCVYEKGDPALGNGNYVIAVEEDGMAVEGVIMMDSHDRMPYTKEDGTVESEWAKLIPEQLDWYRAQIAELEARGCKDSTMIMHIPIYAYREAWAAAFKDGIDSTAEDTCEMYFQDASGAPADKTIKVEKDEMMGRVRAAENFINVICKKEKPFNSPDEAVRLMKIVDAIYASAKSGTPIKLK